MEILNKIKSVKLCLMAHPDNEIDSEFADRISDLEEIENELLKDKWIKIESEEDLPKNNGSYFTKTNYCKETIERDYPIFTKSMSIEDERKWWLENITHYQPIIKPNEPLY